MQLTSFVACSCFHVAHHTGPCARIHWLICSGLGTKQTIHLACVSHCKNSNLDEINKNVTRGKDRRTAKGRGKRYRYVGGHYMLNCFMLSSLSCSHEFVVLQSLHRLCHSFSSRHILNWCLPPTQESRSLSWILLKLLLSNYLLSMTHHICT